MQVHDQAIIHGSAESNWRTPDACFEKLTAAFHFGLDAAATNEDRKCLSHLGPDHPSADLRNALAVPWHLHVRYWSREVGQAIFLNPPFSKTLMNAYNTGRIKVDGAWQPHEKDLVKARAYDIANWAQKCWEESKAGCTIVGIFPFAPQTEWYRQYVWGQPLTLAPGPFHAAMEEWRLPHRISFLRPDGEPAGNAGVNSAIIVWRPNPGFVGPWHPSTRYWSYR